jgi:hypothetical protein
MTSCSINNQLNVIPRGLVSNSSPRHREASPQHPAFYYVYFNHFHLFRPLFSGPSVSSPPSSLSRFARNFSRRVLTATKLAGIVPLITRLPLVRPSCLRRHMHLRAPRRAVSEFCLLLSSGHRVLGLSVCRASTLHTGPKRRAFLHAWLPGSFGRGNRARLKRPHASCPIPRAVICGGQFCVTGLSKEESCSSYPQTEHTGRSR